MTQNVAHDAHVHRFGDGPYRPREQIPLRHKGREKQCVVFLFEKQLARHSDVRVGTEQHMVGPALTDSQPSTDRSDILRTFSPIADQPDRELGPDGQRSAFQDFANQVFGALIVGRTDGEEKRVAVVDARQRAQFARRPRKVHLAHHGGHRRAPATDCRHARPMSRIISGYTTRWRNGAIAAR